MWLSIILVFFGSCSLVWSQLHCPSHPTNNNGSTVDPIGLDHPCLCNTSTVWNDVIFLFDNSEGTGSEHLEDLWITFQTLASAYTIDDTSSTEEKVMRAGIVTYASNATVVVPLGEITSDQIEQLQLNISHNDYATNLKEGIRAAAIELEGPNHRPSSTQVIVIFSTAFNPSGENSPCIIAEEFKENGGIIITYDYQTNDRQDGALQELASPGYSFNSNMTTSEQFVQFQESQCPANCKCMNNHKAYAFNSIPRYPAGGCYWPITAPANGILSSKRCGLSDGSLTKIESVEKQKFLTSLFTPPRSYYIGAKYDIGSSSWFWPDATPLNYTNWCGGSSGSSSQQCAYATQDLSCWQATPCTSAISYICEAPPCDSTNYCGEP